MTDRVLRSASSSSLWVWGWGRARSTAWRSPTAADISPHSAGWTHTDREIAQCSINIVNSDICVIIVLVCYSCVLRCVESVVLYRVYCVMFWYVMSVVICFFMLHMLCFAMLLCCVYVKWCHGWESDKTPVHPQHSHLIHYHWTLPLSHRAIFAYNEFPVYFWHNSLTM